jgi:hypothetical protein
MTYVNKSELISSYMVFHAEQPNDRDFGHMSSRKKEARNMIGGSSTRHGGDDNALSSN